MQPMIEREDSRSMKYAKWVAILLLLATFFNVWAGCIVKPAEPNDFKAVPAHTKVKMRYGLFASAEYENYRDTEARVKCEYSPETKQFKLDAEFIETATTATKAQEGLMAEWTKQQKQQHDALVWVVEQHKAIGENIAKTVGALGDIVKTLTNVLNFKLNKDGIQGGNALAPPPAAATPASDPKFEAFMQEQQRLNQSLIDTLNELKESKDAPPLPPPPAEESTGPAIPSKAAWVPDARRDQVFPKRLPVRYV